RQHHRPSTPHPRTHPRTPVVPDHRRCLQPGPGLHALRRLRLHRRSGPPRPARRGRRRGRHPVRGGTPAVHQPARHLPDTSRPRPGPPRARLDRPPDAHAYFARMKRQNKEGPQVLGPLTPPTELTTEEIDKALRKDEIVFVDTRSHTDVHQGTVAGALNIPGPAKAATFG